MTSMLSRADLKHQLIPNIEKTKCKTDGKDEDEDEDVCRGCEEAASVVKPKLPAVVDVEIEVVGDDSSDEVSIGGLYFPKTEAKATVKVKATNESFNFFTRFF